MDIQIHSLLWPPGVVVRHSYLVDTMDEAIRLAATAHLELAAVPVFERIAWIHYPVAEMRRPLKVRATISGDQQGQQGQQG